MSTSEQESANVRWFKDLGLDDLEQVGGKNSSLGEMVSNLADLGVNVPDGFATTADAYRRFIGDTGLASEISDKLKGLDTDDTRQLAQVGGEIREAVATRDFPEDLEQDIRAAYDELVAGRDDVSFAVRSSATAEDLPTASFAGQQDTYLNVVGPAAILRNVSRCWASLFTERAVTYRRRRGIDHRAVHMAVVVQQMVFPDAAGILFTADPVTGNRRVVSVEAGFGLGEALVSGLVNADVYTVRDGEVVGRESLDAARDRHLRSRAELPVAVQQMSRGEPVIPTVHE